MHNISTITTTVFTVGFAAAAGMAATPAFAAESAVIEITSSESELRP